MNKQNIILGYEDFLKSYKIIKIDSPAKNLFPICLEDSFTEEYAYLIGKVSGDGHLDSNYTLHFIGKEKDLILLHDLIKNMFRIRSYNLSIKRRHSKGVSYLLQVNCAYLGRILYLLGAPMGNKTKTAFLAPKWILSKKNLKKRFLQALLEDELTTIKIERCNYSVKPRLNLSKRGYLIDNLKEFMQQVKEAIESFGVGCSHISRPIDENKSQRLYFHIHRNKKNIIKFKERIGFRFNIDKIEKLENCYKTIKSSIGESRPRISAPEMSKDGAGAA